MNLAFVYMHLRAMPREAESNFQSVRTVPSFDFVRVFARFVGRVAHACRTPTFHSTPCSAFCCATFE